MINKKMSRIIMMVVALSMIFVGCTNKSSENSSSEMSDENMLSTTHYGGAVLKEAAREASDAIYSVSAIEKVEGYKNFNRKVTVYGLTLMIHKDIEDAFVNKITDTL